MSDIKIPKVTENITIHYWEQKKGGRTNINTNMKPFRRIGLLMWVIYRTFRELETGK